MTGIEIYKLVTHGTFPGRCIQPRLVETHISWVVLCEEFVFKIKKPIHYPFLDFSTLEQRRFYCDREVELNNRLAADLYVDVLPVRKKENSWAIGGKEGEILDYAVRMKRLESRQQMDVLLRDNKVYRSDIINLAGHIAEFHKQTKIIDKKEVADVGKKFNDLINEKDFLQTALGHYCNDMIEKAISKSDGFLARHLSLLQSRLRLGWFRDCHGDLHTRNIFLLPRPVIFDCIEFNDDYREIDVLNEVAFLCMDLDASERPDLSELFINTYNSILPAMTSEG
ncbi:MAG TPA: hypothetical protein VFW11_08795, partial [Cyclobacteriaceae bacterium]|nr:hypothetical protein [Cyclobacteriaceae bacterium]